MSSFKSMWNNFWFETQAVPLKSLALFRASLGFILFVFYFLRFLNFESYYGENGFLPLQHLDKYDLNFNYYILEYIQAIGSESVFYFIHIIFLVLLLLLAVGALPRWACFITFIAHVILLHRNPLINYGADYYATYFLFFLSFIRYNSHFSLRPKALTADVLSVVGYRLLQLQIVVAYAYAGFEKLKGQTWWEGKAVWNSIINPQIATFDFQWMAHFPIFIAVLSFMTIIYEVYAPVAFFSKRARRLWIFLGLGFHIGILITLNIPFFALIMTVALLAFVKDSELGFYKAQK